MCKWLFPFIPPWFIWSLHKQIILAIDFKEMFMKQYAHWQQNLLKFVLPIGYKVLCFCLFQANYSTFNKVIPPTSCLYLQLLQDTELNMRLI